MFILKYLYKFKTRMLESSYVEQAIFSVYSLVSVTLIFRHCSLASVAYFYVASNLAYGLALILKSYFLMPQQFTQKPDSDFPEVWLPKNLIFYAILAIVVTFFCLLWRTRNLSLSLEVCVFFSSIVLSEIVRFVNFANLRAKKNIYLLSILIFTNISVSLVSELLEIKSKLIVVLLLITRVPFFVNFIILAFKSFNKSFISKRGDTSLLITIDSILLRLMSIFSLIILTATNIQVATAFGLAYTAYASVPLALAGAVSNSLNRKYSMSYKRKEYFSAILKILISFAFSFLIVSNFSFFNDIFGDKLESQSQMVSFSFVLLSASGAIFQLLLFPTISVLSNKKFLLFRTFSIAFNTVIPYFFIGLMRVDLNLMVFACVSILISTIISSVVILNKSTNVYPQGLERTLEANCRKAIL